MKKIKKLVAIISLVMFTATSFMPLTSAEDIGETPFAHFTSNAFIFEDMENSYMVVQIILSKLEGEISSSHLKLEYDSDFLTFDHYLESNVFEGTLECENDAENGNIVAVQIADDKNVSECGGFMRFYFTYKEAGAVGSIDFGLSAFQVFNADDELVNATANGCWYTFNSYGEIAHFTSEAYIETKNHNDYLVVEVSISKLATEISDCVMYLRFDDNLLTFDHIEEPPSHSRESEITCEGSKVSYTMNSSDPISESGTFLKLFFNYNEAEVIGEIRSFGLEVPELKDLDHTFAGTAEGCAYEFKAKYGEKTMFSSEAYVEDEFIVVQVRLDQISTIEDIVSCVVDLTKSEFLIFDHYEEMGAFMGESSYEPCDCPFHTAVTQTRDEPQILTGRFLKFYYRYDLEQILGETLVFELEAYEFNSDHEKFDAEATGCELTLYHEGDINGDKLVNTGDAVCLLRHISGDELLDEAQLLRSDVNNDGKVNTGDATKILLLIPKPIVD